MSPLVSDVIGPEMNPNAPPKRKRPPYGYQQVPTRPAVKLGRRPTSVEERLLSLSEIPPRLDLEAQRLFDAVTFLRREQLSAATSAETLDDLQVDVLSALRETQVRVARYGAFEFRQERVRQGRVFELSDDASAVYDPIELSMRDDGRSMPSVLALTRRLSQEWKTNVSGAERRVRQTKVDFDPAWRMLAERCVEYGVRSVTRALVNEAFAIGRGLELSRGGNKYEDEDPTFLLFSSVLDANTCEDCEEADGTVVVEGSDDADTMQPPYYKCGGNIGDENRCRCLYLEVDSKELMQDHLKELLELRGRR